MPSWELYVNVIPHWKSWGFYGHARSAHLQGTQHVLSNGRDVRGQGIRFKVEMFVASLSEVTASSKFTASVAVNLFSRSRSSALSKPLSKSS